MVETGTGEEKRKGSASTPREVPSNFSPVVTPMAEVDCSHLPYVQQVTSDCEQLLSRFVKA